MKINLNDIISKEIHGKVDGGLADNKSIEEIAKNHNVPVELIELMLKWGIDVEMEHTTDREIAMEIAMDHLIENPFYYKDLQDMEKNYEQDFEGKFD